MAPAAEYPHSTIAVGYDGSLTARLAVRWAAEYAAHAAEEQCRLRVVHAWVWPLFTKNLGPVKGIPGSGLRHSAEAILAEGIELARGVASASAASASAAAAATARQPAAAPAAVDRPRRAAAAPAPSTSRASWKPDSPPRCCARQPPAHGCWSWAAAASAAYWASWRARSAWTWPAPPRAP